MSWDENMETILLTEPKTRTIQGTSINTTELPDVYCRHCGKGGVTGVIFGDDHPPKDETVPARCWSCGETFAIHWTLEPIWYEGEPI